MTAVFIDADVLIDVLRQVPLALATLRSAKERAPLAASVIVRMEVVAGSNNRESLQQTERLLKQLKVVPLDEEISHLADILVTRFCLSNGLRVADALIAATAIRHEAPLLTKNERDFRFIPDLQLLPYPKAKL